MAALFPSIDKQLQTRLAIVAAQTVVVCRPFIAKHRDLRQRRMYLEMRIMIKNGAQHAPGGLRFAGAVEFVVQVSNGQMHFAVQRIRRRRNGGGIRHPHRGG